MPRPKTGGRQAGTPNKRKGDHRYREVMDQHGCCAIEAVALHMLDQVPCIRCDDEGMVTPLFGFYARGSTSATAFEKAQMMSDLGEKEICPFCAGTKHKFLDDGEQLKAAIRLLDSDLPKLSSVVIKDSGSKVVFARMNALERMQREEAELRITQQEAEDKEARDK